MVKAFIKFVIFFIFISSSSISLAGKLDKAFDALSIHNYFKAKAIFEKRISKKKAPSAFGLSIVYGRNNNPFYNLDSAYAYICMADSAFSNLESKKKLKLLDFKVDSLAINNWKDTIDNKAFRVVKSRDKLESYIAYINRFSDSRYRIDAINKRDSILFLRAKFVNSSNSYITFISTHPNSIYNVEAIKLYENVLFQEVVQQNSIGFYSNFIKNYPSNPFVGQAQDSVYRIFTEAKTIKSYDSFIKQFSKNKNVNLAWRKLFNAYMKDFTENRIVEFQIDYPRYPFKNELKQNMNYMNTQFIPFILKGKWGFIGVKGQILIKPTYSFVGQFSEGLALVSFENKIGFIDKTGQIVIPLIYEEAEPFHNGLSVVGLGNNYGIINRNNEIIVPLNYEFIGEFNDSLALISVNDKAGFVDLDGKIIIDIKYETASDYKNGLSIVEIDGRQGLINKKGKIVLPIEFSKIHLENQSIRIQRNIKYGLLTYKGDTILPFEYDYISKFSSGLALIQIGNKYGYCNQKGQIIIKPSYYFTNEALIWADFIKGYAKFSRKDKFGIIDSTGKEVVPAIFENLKDYSPSQLFPVKKNGAWGFSNALLQLKIPYNYLIAEPFFNSRTIVKNDTAFGIIDLDGNWILKPKYDKIIRINNYYIVSEQEEVKLYGSNLEILLSQGYASIEQYDSILLKLVREGNSHFYNIENQTLIIPQSK